MLFKIVRGMVPAIHSADFISPIKAKRQIRAKKYSDYQYKNPVEKSVTNNSQCYSSIDSASSNNFKTSFFIKTIVDWNHLEEGVISAGTV